MFVQGAAFLAALAPKRVIRMPAAAFTQPVESKSMPQAQIDALAPTFKVPSGWDWAALGGILVGISADEAQTHGMADDRMWLACVLTTTGIQSFASQIELGGFLDRLQQRSRAAQGQSQGQGPLLEFRKIKLYRYVKEQEVQFLSSHRRRHLGARLKAHA